MSDHSGIPDPSAPLAVLVSGGLDSSILLAEASLRHPAVHPLFLRSGLAWETAELEHLRRFLDAIARPSLKPLVVLDQPVQDVYGRHWSVTGDGVPAADTPDDSVYLPGRNVFLLAKPLVWCHLNEVAGLALAPLAANPFPDATPAFFAAFASVVNQAVQGTTRVFFPYLSLSKADVLRRGAGLPLEWTFSCIRPLADGGTARHCGECNKCAERRHGFRLAGLADPTRYGFTGTATPLPGAMSSPA